ncbi:MAG: hypothetical protein M0Z27_05060 [Thermaerobacter sp.]|nr:hypothetical protein [Thermaerobacter sp.]
MQHEEAQPPKEKGPVFAHPSEEEFSRLLDFYGISWQYEPRTFPLRTDADGKVVEAFSPDFYLPDYDLYIELTTVKSNLVAKKKRKIRLFRELYPQVNLKIFYRRDYQQFFRKYGSRP